MRRNRKTRIQPSQLNRKKQRPEKVPGVVYTVESYRRAIAYGIKRANKAIEAEEGTIPFWHPHQLRHSAATRLRREFGIDVARAVLGHSSPAVTELYAEMDGAKAAEAMAKVG
jgi:integrase